MNHNRTASILQRVPRILAVTAASYGLSLEDRKDRKRAHPPRIGSKGAKKEAKAA
jgi:hypothetical protein